MSAVATRISRRTPASLPDAFQGAYAPGLVRRSTDAEHAAVTAFVARHPEYDRLSHVELATLAATYVGPELAAERGALEDAGVPADWHRPNEDNDEETC